jgi:hypothetical protein
MAPELLDPEKDTTRPSKESDMYALAMTMLEVIIHLPTVVFLLNRSIDLYRNGPLPRLSKPDCDIQSNGGAETRKA